MSILSQFETKAPKTLKTVRQKCYDYAGAYEYFQTRVAEMEEKGTYSWVKYNENDGDWEVRVTLHSMPLYWKVDHVLEGGKQVLVEIKNPQGEVIETRNKVIGHTALVVPSEEAGIELLHNLAKSEDKGFKEILTTAAKALYLVDEQELKHINEYAETLFNDSNWVEEFGEWDDRDATSEAGNQVYSKGKTNKMNQFKQLARRRLGYERAKVEVEAIKKAPKK